MVKMVSEVHPPELSHGQCSAHLQLLGRLRGLFPSGMGCEASPTHSPVLQEMPVHQGFPEPLSEWIHQKGLLTGKSSSCGNGLIRFPQGGNCQFALTSLCCNHS